MPRRARRNATRTKVRRRARRPETGDAVDLRADAETLLQRAVARSGDSVTLMIADDHAHYVAASGATRQLTGYDSNELAALSVWDLTPLPNTPEGQGLWQQFIAAGTQEGHTCCGTATAVRSKRATSRSPTSRPAGISAPSPKRPTCRPASAAADQSSGFSAKQRSRTIRPPMRCSWMMRSAFSGVTFRYQVPSGYTTQIGPAGADAQALALRPVERTVRAGQVQLLHALLQVAPGLVPLVGVDAVRTDTDEQVPRQLSHAECFCDGARELILPFAHMKIPAPGARIAARSRVPAGIGRDSRVFPPPPPRRLGSGRFRL